MIFADVKLREPKGGRLSVRHPLTVLAMRVALQLMTACVAMSREDTLAWLWTRLKAVLERHDVVFVAEPLKDLSCFLMTSGTRFRFVYGQDLSDGECMALFFHVLGHLEEGDAVTSEGVSADFHAYYEVRDARDQSIYLNGRCRVAQQWAEEFTTHLIEGW